MAFRQFRASLINAFHSKLFTAWVFIFAYIFMSGVATFSPERIRTIFDDYEGRRPLCISYSRMTSHGGFTSTGKTFLLVPYTLKPPVLVQTSQNNQSPDLRVKIKPPFEDKIDQAAFILELMIIYGCLAFSLYQIVKSVLTRIIDKR